MAKAVRNGPGSKGKGKSRPVPSQKVVKNFSKGAGKKGFQKGGRKGRNFENGQGHKLQGRKGGGRDFSRVEQHHRERSGKGFRKGVGKRERNQHPKAFHNGAGRKGKGGGKLRQGRFNNKPEKGASGGGLKIAKAAFQKKLGRFARKGGRMLGGQPHGETRKPGFARKGEKIFGQRNGERRKGSGKGKGKGKGKSRRLNGKPMGGKSGGEGAGQRLAMLGKFARRSLGKSAGKGQRKGKGKGKGKGKWVFVPDGKTAQKMAPRMSKTSKKSKGEGKKSKGEGKNAAHPNPKVELNNGLSLIFGRECKKDDCDYNVAEENGKHMAILTIDSLEKEPKTFTGKPAKTDGEAMRNAAKQALAELSGAMRKARGAARAAKKEKRTEAAPVA